MSEIFNSEEIRRLEQEQFLKKNSYFFMQKAGKRVFEFINNQFKNKSKEMSEILNSEEIKLFEHGQFLKKILTLLCRKLASEFLNLLTKTLKIKTQ